MTTRRIGQVFGIAILSTASRGLLADGPNDNSVERVRPIPPAGVTLAPPDAQELAQGVAELGKAIASLETQLEGKPALELVPDVRIFHNAVRYALENGEFFDLKEVGAARELLRLGKERARQLAAGDAPWTQEKGLVVRGYVSKIDGSVQPYGLVVPETLDPKSPHRHRVDCWFHGRGETLSELSFITGRLKSLGDFAPFDAIVLHPYGRYCNANKFAGEVDLFEALDSVQRRYRVDEDRIVVRGFSMGGASCWQFAVHYAGLWAAAAPGAGFAETPEFLRVFQNEAVQPTWYEQRLWRLYDCTGYAGNLVHCPTVAYSGEKDRQKQAADVMAAALRAEGVDLVHVIGPGMGHAYAPASKDEINRRIDAIAARGRDSLPRRVRFTTYTLRYDRMAWVKIEGLERHWSRARVVAEVASDNEVHVETDNVRALALEMPPGLCPLDATRRPRITLDGRRIDGPGVGSDRSWTARLRKIGGEWVEASDPRFAADDARLQKRHGLQGPVDDAFFDSFIFVKPTGQPLQESVGAWVEREMSRAVVEWRRQFRGEARVLRDDEVTEELAAKSHLVLWGDPSSNKILARIAGKLPIQWSATELKAGAESFPPAQHVPILIYPNPEHPARYVVLNSGFTFREYDYLNNARQVPKLPDWAIVDLSQPPSPRAPGRIAAAGFFGENWELLADGGRSEE